MILTEEQSKIAEHVGRLRVKTGEGRPDLLDCANSPAGKRHVEGAVAECYVAIASGQPWRAYQANHKSRKEVNVPDVGPFEVKSVRARNHRIILHSTPLLQSPHLLVLTQKHSPTQWECELLGWCFGFEIWDKKWWDTTLPTPAYARPADSLYSKESLVKWAKSHQISVNRVEKPLFHKDWEPA